MDIQEYIKNRLDPQIAWYDQKASHNQKMYKSTQTCEIVLAALIPLLSGYAERTFIAVLIGIIGLIITILQSIVKLNKYHEQWLEYRSTCELLKYQKHLFLTGSSPYNESDELIENIFVRNIEQTISSENNLWKNLNNKANNKNSQT